MFALLVRDYRCNVRIGIKDLKFFVETINGTRTMTAKDCKSHLNMIVYLPSKIHDLSATATYIQYGSYVKLTIDVASYKEIQ